MSEKDDKTTPLVDEYLNALYEQAKPILNAELSDATTDADLRIFECADEVLLNDQLAKPKYIKTLVFLSSITVALVGVLLIVLDIQEPSFIDSPSLELVINEPVIIDSIIDKPSSIDPSFIVQDNTRNNTRNNTHNKSIINIEAHQIPAVDLENEFITPHITKDKKTVDQLFQLVTAPNSPLDGEGADVAIESLSSLYRASIASEWNQEAEAAAKTMEAGLAALNVGNYYHPLGYSAAHYFIGLKEAYGENEYTRAGLQYSFNAMKTNDYPISQLKIDLTQTIVETKKQLSSAKEKVERKRIKVILKHLKSAAKALRKQRYTYPKNKNVYFHFLTILTLQPDFVLAQEGIESVLIEEERLFKTRIQESTLIEVQEQISDLRKGDICPLFLQYMSDIYLEIPQVIH